ncbi:MAG: LysM peptidoglycan-binding domain-containing protein [Verrucomicrobiota bacterium]
MSNRFLNLHGGLLLSCLLWAGCDERPWVSGKADPKEESNYRQAEAYQRMNQYAKAIEYYQRALDVNPRNADAHLGLGIIHSDSAKLPEYGFAYYHLRRYVGLSGRTNDLIVNQLIRATGLRLAEMHADAIGKIQTQGQLEQMRRENDELRKSVASLSNQLHAATPRAGSPPLSPLSQATNGSAQPPRPQAPLAKLPEPPTRPSPQGTIPKRSSTPKTYTLKSGDTLAKIAKAQGITLQQLQNANPGLDTRKLKTGSEIKVP